MPNQLTALPCDQQSLRRGAPASLSSAYLNKHDCEQNDLEYTEHDIEVTLTITENTVK